MELSEAAPLSVLTGFPGLEFPFPFGGEGGKKALYKNEKYRFLCLLRILAKFPWKS